MTHQNNNNDMNEVINSMLAQVQSGDKISPQQLLQASMNIFMLAERQLHLQQNHEDKGNGFFERKLGTPLGNLELNIPRDRDGDFRPSILPKPRQRDVNERFDILEAMLVNGYSPNAIADSLHALGLHYSTAELSALKQNFLDIYQQWINRQLTNDIIALFIDVYHANANINNKVHKVSLYVIVGIDFEGKKDLYGFYLNQGAESKAYWLQVLNQLIDRGLKRPLCIISDDFPGLKAAIATLFPKTIHQLCLIHMQRNVRKNMSAEHASQFNERIHEIKTYKNYEQAQEEFKALCQTYHQTYPTFTQSLEQDTTQYFAFLQLPKKAQKHFYTTNTVESVNSILEKIRQRHGGFFQSEQSLQVNVFLIIKKLKEKKWLKGIPLVQACLYDFRQLFAQKYDELPRES